MAASSRFAPATRQQARLRALFESPPGNGKTYTALSILSALIAPVPDKSMEKRIAVIDTENGRSQMYASGNPFYFSVLVLDDFSPEGYIGAIEDAAAEGFTHLLVDSVSDEWNWTLEEIDRLQTPASGKKLDKRGAWGEMTPRHNTFLRALTRVPMHVAATVLMKPEYAMVDDPDRPGKKKMTRVGLAPVQREGLERLFDIAGVMEEEAELTFIKTLCQPLYGQRFKRPGVELAQTIGAWLETGEQIPATTNAMVDALAEKASLDRESWLEAVETLRRWCVVRGVATADLEKARAHMKEVVKERVTKTKEGADVRANAAAATPPPADTAPPAAA